VEHLLGLGVESEDILLVSGPIGSGKSVALRSFISALDPKTLAPLLDGVARLLWEEEKPIPE